MRVVASRKTGRLVALLVSAGNTTVPEPSVLSVRFSDFGPPVRFTLAPASGSVVTASMIWRLIITHVVPPYGGAEADETYVTFVESTLLSLFRVTVTVTFL